MAGEFGYQRDVGARLRENDLVDHCHVLVHEATKRLQRCAWVAASLHWQDQAHNLLRI